LQRLQSAAAPNAQGGSPLNAQEEEERVYLNLIERIDNGLEDADKAVSNEGIQLNIEKMGDSDDIVNEPQESISSKNKILLQKKQDGAPEDQDSVKDYVLSKLKSLVPTMPFFVPKVFSFREGDVHNYPIVDIELELTWLQRLFVTFEIPNSR